MRNSWLFSQPVKIGIALAAYTEAFLGALPVKIKELIRAGVLRTVPDGAIGVAKALARDFRIALLKLTGRHQSSIKKEWDLQIQRAGAENLRGKKQQALLQTSGAHRFRRIQ